MQKNFLQSGKFIRIRKISQGIRDRTMHRRADISYDRVIIALHSTADPVEHDADKTVFIKFSHELFLLLCHAQTG